MDDDTRQELPEYRHPPVIEVDSRAYVHQHTSVYQARTELGRKLAEIRARIVASGDPLLAREQILKEVAERRGEPGETQG